jgi:hypothetical protein
MAEWVNGGELMIRTHLLRELYTAFLLALFMMTWALRSQGFNRNIDRDPPRIIQGKFSQIPEIPNYQACEAGVLAAPAPDYACRDGDRAWLPGQRSASAHGAGSPEKIAKLPQLLLR